MARRRLVFTERTGRPLIVQGVPPAPTSRLRFREMVAADLPHIETLDLGGSRGPAGWIQWTRRNYQEHGFGLWVIETHAGEFVGDCGLTMQEVEGEWLVEAGWHVRGDLRRRGYAAEAAEAAEAVLGPPATPVSPT